MGIFDWLKGPKTNVELLDDVIWLTKQAKHGGISACIGRCLPDLSKIIVDYKCTISGGRLTLEVSSALIPKLA